MVKDMAMQHLPQKPADLVDYPEKQNEDSTLGLYTLVFPIEKLSVAAGLPSSAQDKDHQKKIQTCFNSKILEVCLTTKGF